MHRDLDHPRGAAYRQEFTGQTINSDGILATTKYIKDALTQPKQLYKMNLQDGTVFFVVSIGIIDAIERYREWDNDSDGTISSIELVADQNVMNPAGMII